MRLFSEFLGAMAVFAVPYLFFVLAFGAGLMGE